VFSMLPVNSATLCLILATLLSIVYVQLVGAIK